MPVLSDQTILEFTAAGRLRIQPFVTEHVQPSSVDLRLGRHFRVFEHSRYTHIDVREPQPGLTQGFEVLEGEPFVLHPGEFALGATLERVGLPDDLVGRLEGKSSLGRLGLIIHSTAGYIDPGFDGTITLELSNVAKLPIPLYPGMFIGQISFLTMTTPVDRPYGSPGLGSKYQGQEQPTESKVHLSFQSGNDE
jgi:dCTP deaminase